MGLFKKIAYITTAGTAPATEAFATLNLVKTGSTATKFEASFLQNGGIVQFRNDATARDYEAKVYLSMVDSPGLITNGDWIEYDVKTIGAQVGDVLGTDKIIWSRPYKWMAVSISAASATAGAVLIDIYGHF